MALELRPLCSDTLEACISVWNQVVAEGQAFPQKPAGCDPRRLPEPERRL